MNSKIHLFMIITVFCAVATGAFGAGPDVISNGLMEIRIDAERGRFDVIDLKRGLPIISDSQVGFSIAPYVELAGVAPDAFETEQKTTDIKSANCINTVNSEGALKSSFSKGKSVSMFSRKAGHGQLQVQFTLYPEKTFVDISFAFKNLNKQPVRLRQVNVIDCDRFMPSCDRACLQLLNGGSGLAKTTVVKGQNMRAENNILCFFADRKQPRSLVAGGMTYADFRKHVKINKGALSMYAEDPVGKRIDPGQTYKSVDRFYLDGMTDNPFEALESYAKATEKARGIKLNYYTFPSTCMWFLSVTHFGGDTGSTNNTVGAVEEMRRIADSGFLKYCPVAVRLVPDCYEQNNQQGWWGDEHWQMHGRKERCVVERHYEKPYETTKKWATAVKELGGIPLTYFQPGIRSEDYARAFPGHMLYNQSNKYIKKDGEIVGDPHWVIGKRGIPDLVNPGKWLPGYGKLFQETYDYTDPGFLKHWTEVNQNLKTGGVQGVFYDYPDRAFAKRGGFEDRYATATHAYRNVFRIARKQQGKNAYLQERIGPGSDATLEFVSSVRTAGDTNTISSRLVNQVAMRWYKNRRLTNYDMDGKALIRSGHGKNIHKIDAVERRAILTLSYAVSGRLLLTESFRLFSDEVLGDLSRLYPFHATTLTARPLDAFIRSQPTVFDFPISPSWHQFVLYNGPENDREFEIPISGDTAFGIMGLDADRQYYIYDFWNDRFVGKVSGNSSIEQAVAAGEARMLSVHAAENNPQWISTDRHIMQGYVDLVKKPQWNENTKTLSGTSYVIGGQPYRITMALNGYDPKKVTANGATADITTRTDNKNLADIVLKVKENRDVIWEITFSKGLIVEPDGTTGIPAGINSHKCVLIEAESFDDTGGWVVDSQFMDLMGSPFLLAHGLGCPVNDAETRVKFPKTGKYRVWVRTRDWVGPWKKPETPKTKRAYGTPGKFHVLVDGKALETTFGTEGSQWHWHDGGIIEIRKKEVYLALHDLTGFEGRCDAILFSQDHNFIPPSSLNELTAFRRKLRGTENIYDSGEYDLVVVGGGIAGTCAAVSAARNGLTVALIQDRSVLGGNNSSEVRVWLQGARNKEPWSRVGDVVAELEASRRAHYGSENKADLYEDDKKLAVVRGEPNIKLLLEYRGNGVEMEGKRIRAVLAEEIRTGKRIRLVGRWFADCTGDACIGALAGADFDMQKKNKMGPCNLWNVCECKDTNAINTGIEESAEAVDFPRCPWALDLSDKPFPGRDKVKPDTNKLGGWYWESGFDRDPIKEMEYVRDWNFRAMYGAWDTLKNADKVLPNHKLNWAGYILGKRESRRLLGDVILDVEDLMQDRKFPDGCAPTGWDNDLHLPSPQYNKGFEGDAFISIAKHGYFPAFKENRPFWIPYRCLYSRNIDNLFMAGRCISVTHEALGAVRVMRTCGSQGEIVGMAASVCKEFDTNPRGVYKKHLADLQKRMRKGVGKVDGSTIPYLNQGERGHTVRQVVGVQPTWLRRAGENLARIAEVSTITSAKTDGVNRTKLLNDGSGKLEDNSARWLGKGALPHIIEYRWDKPVKIGAARIISGWYNGIRVLFPVSHFKFQHHDGQTWQDVLPAVEGNGNPAWSATFAPVKTKYLRLVITRTPHNISRVWEVEFYQPLKDERQLTVSGTQ